MFHERIKHIDVRYHFLRDVVPHGDIIVGKVSTHDNRMGMLTKSLLVAKFGHCLNLIGVC